MTKREEQEQEAKAVAAVAKTFREVLIELDQAASLRAAVDAGVPLQRKRAGVVTKGDPLEAIADVQRLEESAINKLARLIVGPATHAAVAVMGRVQAGEIEIVHEGGEYVAKERVG